MPAASVAQRSRPGRHRVRSVVCPGCQEPRTVTYETYQRIQNGQLSGICARCPGPVVIETTEEHRRFWLVAFGVPAADLEGISVAAYVGRHGAPAELLALAASVRQMTR